MFSMTGSIKRDGIRKVRENEAKKRGESDSAEKINKIAILEF